MDAATPAPIGHNNPPPAVPSDLQARLDAFVETGGQWLDLKALTDVAEAQRVNDYLTGLRKVRGEIDDARKDAKAPFDAGAAEVQAAFTPAIATADTAIKRVKPLVDAWALQEKDRLAKAKTLELLGLAAAVDAAVNVVEAAVGRNDLVGETVARKALAEAQKALKKAGGKANAPKVTVGSATGGGRTMGMRTMVTPSIANATQAVLHYRDHPDMAELLLRLAAADLRAGVDRAELIGFTFTEQEVLA